MTAFVLIRSNGWEIVFVQTDLPCEIMGLLRIWRWWNSVTHVISIEGSLSYFLLKSSLMKRDHTASIMAPSSRDNKRIHGSATDFNNRSCLETCAWTKWIAWIEQVNRAIKIYGLNKLLSKSSYSNYHTMCIKRRCRKQKKKGWFKRTNKSLRPWWSMKIILHRIFNVTGRWKQFPRRNADNLRGNRLAISIPRLIVEKRGSLQPLSRCCSKLSQQSAGRTTWLVFPNVSEVLRGSPSSGIGRRAVGHCSTPA